MIANLCSAPKVHIGNEFVSSSNEMLMVFKSDNSVSRSGFMANYESGDRAHFSAICVDVALLTPLPLIFIVCGGRLVAVETPGNIYSHAKYGGDDYGSKMNCEWVIETNIDGMVIRLEFTQFDLEQQQNCDYDYVTIIDSATAVQQSYDDEEASGRNSQYSNNNNNANNNVIGRYCNQVLKTTPLPPLKNVWQL